MKQTNGQVKWYYVTICRCLVTTSYPLIFTNTGVQCHLSTWPLYTLMPQLLTNQSERRERESTNPSIIGRQQHDRHSAMLYDILCKGSFMLYITYTWTQMDLLCAFCPDLCVLPELMNADQSLPSHCKS